LIFIGIRLCFEPLVAIVSIIKVFGTITAAASTAVSFFFGTGLSLMVISLAWIFYRPAVALTLLGIGLVIGYIGKTW